MEAVRQTDNQEEPFIEGEDTAHLPTDQAMALHLQGAPLEKQHIPPLLQPLPGACPHPGALSKGWSTRRNSSCFELGLSGT